MLARRYCTKEGRVSSNIDSPLKLDVVPCLDRLEEDKKCEELGDRGKVLVKYKYCLTCWAYVAWNVQSMRPAPAIGTQAVIFDRRREKGGMRECMYKHNWWAGAVRLQRLLGPLASCVLVCYSSTTLAVSSAGPGTRGRMHKRAGVVS